MSYINFILLYKLCILYSVLAIAHCLWSADIQHCDYNCNCLMMLYAVGLRTCSWPGRSQIITGPGVSYYLDGAHTAESIQVSLWRLKVSTFLQRVGAACYAKRCSSYRKSVCPSVCLSVCPSVTVWQCVKTTQARIMGSSLEDSPMTLVSSCLTAARNSKVNLGSEGAEWERGGKSCLLYTSPSPRD